jgi:hypothetical protein
LAVVEEEAVGSFCRDRNSHEQVNRVHRYNKDIAKVDSETHHRLEWEMNYEAMSR